ncbi:MAG TPA: TetR/AcrR family transcriptional regulator [Acidimicrobiia bacterium]|nr:TetR/AcrR family transcriptional regulator [Acidimicrobiia bacterium]
MRTVPRWLSGSTESLAGVFAREGFRQARMEELAAAAGVPRATLYYHFSGKDEVLAWLLRSTLADLRAAVEEAVAGAGDASRRLRAVLRAQVGLMGRHPAACRVLLANLDRAGHLPDIAAGVAEAFHDPVAQLLVEGVADGSLRRVDDPARTAGVVFGAVTIAALQALVVDPVFQPEAVAAAVLDVVLTGLEGR